MAEGITNDPESPEATTMNKEHRISMTVNSWACFLLLLFASMPVFSGQSVISIIEPRSAGGQPSWVDTCLSNGYHRLVAKDLTNAVLAKQSSTNVFVVLRSVALDSSTVELEAVNVISGITIYLKRLDVSILTPRRMTTILHAVEEKGMTARALDEAITVTVSEWQGATREQKDLTFALRKALVQSKDILVTAQLTLRMYLMSLQDLVMANHLSVPFPVSGGMFPARYCLKPRPIPDQILSCYVVDTSSGLVADTITIKSKNDIPAAIKKIMLLRPGQERME